MGEVGAFILHSTSFAFLAVTSAGPLFLYVNQPHSQHARPKWDSSSALHFMSPWHSASSAPSHIMLEGLVWLPKPSMTPQGTLCPVALAAMALLHSGAGVPSSKAQEWMPRRPPMYTMRVSPDTNSAIAHAEGKDEPGLTTVRMPPRASMFAAILKASPTNPPGLSSSNVSNFGSAANCAASPSSIGPDACTVKWSRQVKAIASATTTPASKKPAAIAIRLNIPLAPMGYVPLMPTRASDDV